MAVNPINETEILIDRTPLDETHNIYIIDAD
jgi:hypothetical protein